MGTLLRTAFCWRPWRKTSSLAPPCVAAAPISFRSSRYPTHQLQHHRALTATVSELRQCSPSAGCRPRRCHAAMQLVMFAAAHRGPRGSRRHRGPGTAASRGEGPTAETARWLIPVPTPLQPSHRPRVEAVCRRRPVCRGGHRVGRARRDGWGGQAMESSCPPPRRYNQRPRSAAPPLRHTPPGWERYLLPPPNEPGLAGWVRARSIPIPMLRGARRRPQDR
jgi:hypothetical protein